MIAIVYADFLFDDRNESFFEFATFLSSHRKGLLYESSFEIYTKLYNFYSSNGDSLQAKHAHYTVLHQLDQKIIYPITISNI